MIGSSADVKQNEVEEFDRAKANGMEFPLEAAGLTSSLMERQHPFDNGVLDLSQKYLRDDHIQFLARGLRCNRSITKLDLSRRPEHPVLLRVQRCFGTRGIFEIVEALRENRTLTKLDLRWIKITDEALRALADALHDNPALLELKITAPKVMAVADHISHEEKIKKVQSRLENNLQCVKFYLPQRPPSIEEVEKVRALIKRNQINDYWRAGSLLSYLLDE